jgi:hypothetical protein
LNLLLVDSPKATIPDDKQRELALALMELLIDAAQASDAEVSNGADNEPETHC